MHLWKIFLFAAIAFFWVFHGLRVAYGAVRLPWLKNFSPAANEDCPSLSLLFAARDEQEKLPAALATLAALDYPRLEIIAVDDRSQDVTGQLLEECAWNHPRFRVLHVRELPAGWLGKTHALQKAYEASSGELLLFTDADVRFAPDVLRRAVTLLRERGLDHLSLMGDIELHGFWETVAITFFGLGFQLATDPYRVENPHARAYVGVGAFQLVKRSAYEAMGTHRRLALEVVEDMKLGQFLKQRGFRSGVGVAQSALSVRWHEGLRNLIRGVTKNFFAGVGYSLPLAALLLALIVLLNIAPFVAVIFAHGWTRIFAAIAVVIALCFHLGVDRVMRVSPLYALTHPLGALLVTYMLLRSTLVTLWNGGVTWRDTFYPLEELKKHKLQERSFSA